MNDEEIAQLQEDLTEARAEVDALQTAVADREARTLHLESQLATARDELTAAREAIDARGGQLEELRARSETLESAVRSSAERYRALALERSPELPAELVAGDTVDEIDESLDRARETVTKVRGHLEAHALSGRFPVGAPARTEPDLSGLSAQEKIARGIEQRRSA